MVEIRETYIPEVLEEDKLRFDVYSSMHTKRVIVITVLSLIANLLLLSGINYFFYTTSFMRRLFLPSEILWENTIQIIISYLGFWVLIYAIDRFIFFQKELRVVRDERIQQSVLVGRNSGPTAAIEILNSLPPNFKSLAFYRLMWLFNQCLDPSTDFEQFYQTCKDRWELEEKRLDSEYAIADVFIWSMPILGFIGTVIGISFAVGEFSSFLNVSGNEIEMGLIKEKLAEVASGLSFAFDTTLLGLTSSLMGTLGISIAGTQESEFLSRLKALCLDVVSKK